MCIETNVNLDKQLNKLELLEMEGVYHNHTKINIKVVK